MNPTNKQTHTDKQRRHIMKKVYIVKGSEDGILGVFSSKSKARQRATNYVLAGCEIHLLDPTIITTTTKWNEWFSSADTRATAEIIIEELQ
jgi:hypothetical protein